jgi:hypothetical protein
VILRTCRQLLVEVNLRFGDMRLEMSVIATCGDALTTFRTPWFKEILKVSIRNSQSIVRVSMWDNVLRRGHCGLWVHCPKGEKPKIPQWPTRNPLKQINTCGLSHMVEIMLCTEAINLGTNGHSVLAECPVYSQVRIFCHIAHKHQHIW